MTDKMRKLSGIGGWLPEIGNITQQEIERMAPPMKTRGDLIVQRTRSTGIRGWRSTEDDNFTGIHWEIPSTNVYNSSQPLPSLDEKRDIAILVNERDLLPLYCCTDYELNDKLATLPVHVPLITGDRPKVILELNRDAIYETLLLRDPGNVSYLKPHDPEYDEIFHFAYSDEDLMDPIGQFGYQMYIPRKDLLPETISLMVSEVIRGVWAVNIVVMEMIVAPTCFPVENEGTIDMTYQYDYGVIDVEGGRPSMVERETYYRDTALLDHRCKPGGQYNDGRSSYTLTYNRSGQYGPVEDTLKAIKKFY